MLTKIGLVRALVFPVVMYGCESWNIKKTERQRTDAFKLWCWRRLLRVPWTARKSNQSILKEINCKYSWAGLTLKLKLQYFGHFGKKWLIGKDPDAGKTEGRRKGMTEVEMGGWHHWLNGHEFEQVLGDGDGQGSLACCSAWGCKESDTTWQLNSNHKYPNGRAKHPLSVLQVPYHRISPTHQSFNNPPFLTLIHV